VQEESGVPGEGFIAAAQIPELQQRVFQRDWLEHCPSSDDFEEALRQQP
jgi:hypothetical protein